MRFTLVVNLIVLATPLIAQQTQPNNWIVELADGSNTRLSVTLSSSDIVFRTVDTGVPTISFPVSAINGIFHSTQKIRRSTQAFNFFNRMCCAGTGVQLLPLLAAAIAAPTGASREHYVDVSWFLNGDGQVSLEVSKDQYVGFMEWLQQLSGVKWQDIDSERQSAIEEINRTSGAAFLVKFDPSTKYETYRVLNVIPIDRADGTELYFFNGAPKPANLVSILPASREWSDNSSCINVSRVLYAECPRSACEIDAIVLPAVTFRVKRKTPVKVTESPARPPSDCERLAKQDAKAAQQTTVGDDTRPTLRRRPD